MADFPIFSFSGGSALPDVLLSNANVSLGGTTTALAVRPGSSGHGAYSTEDGHSPADSAFAFIDPRPPPQIAPVGAPVYSLEAIVLVFTVGAIAILWIVRRVERGFRRATAIL